MAIESGMNIISPPSEGATEYWDSVFNDLQSLIKSGDMGSFSIVSIDSGYAIKTYAIKSSYTVKNNNRNLCKLLIDDDNYYHRIYLNDPNNSLLSSIYYNPTVGLLVLSSDDGLQIVLSSNAYNLKGSGSTTGLCIESLVSYNPYPLWWIAGHEPISGYIASTRDPLWLGISSPQSKGCRYTPSGVYTIWNIGGGDSNVRGDIMLKGAEDSLLDGHRIYVIRSIAVDAVT